MISIGALAKKTGAKAPTIRYYEQVGLMAAAERTAGNQRRYTDRDAERLRFILHARELGFSIEAIKDLIELSDHPDRPCLDANRIAEEQLAAVRARIARLRRLEAELVRIATECSAETAAQCYVLKALADHSLCDDDHRPSP